MAGWIWLILIVLGILAETFTTQLVVIWFVFGFIGGLIASLFGASVWLQVAIALSIGIAALIATRPFVKKLSGPEHESTNADRYIGMTGIVTEDIDPMLGTGRANVLGLSWAVFTEGERIEKGSRVQVDAIEGVKLKVHIVE